MAPQCSPESYSHPSTSFAAYRSPKFFSQLPRPRPRIRAATTWPELPPAPALALGLLPPPLQRRSRSACTCRRGPRLRPRCWSWVLRGALVKVPCSEPLPTNPCACDSGPGCSGASSSRRPVQFGGCSNESVCSCCA